MTTIYFTYVFIGWLPELDSGGLPQVSVIISGWVGGFADPAWVPHMAGVLVGTTGLLGSGPCGLCPPAGWLRLIPIAEWCSDRKRRAQGFLRSRLWTRTVWLPSPSIGLSKSQREPRFKAGKQTPPLCGRSYKACREGNCGHFGNPSTNFWGILSTYQVLETEKLSVVV